jgi:hypothetical protein
MKRLLLCVAAVIAGATFASAQDVKIEKKTEDRPGIRNVSSRRAPLGGLAGLARLFPERPKRSAHREPTMIPFERKILPRFVSNMPG